MVIFTTKIALIGNVIGDRIEKTFRRLSRKFQVNIVLMTVKEYPVKTYAILKAKGNHRSSEPSTDR